MFHRRCVLDLRDKDRHPLVEEVHWGPKAKVWKVFMKFWVRIAKAYQGLTNFGRRQTFALREVDLANFAQLPGLTGCQKIHRCECIGGENLGYVPF